MKLQLLCSLILFAACRVPVSLPSEKQPQPPSEYQEPYRPLAHFTVLQGQQSDVNGIFQYNGVFHLSYQFTSDLNPNMTYQTTGWGHAISTDLIHWRETAPIIYPDTKGGTPAFSGTTVADEENVSGLKTGFYPPILSFYTCANYIANPKLKSKQCLAYSGDGGILWWKLPTPVIGETTQYARDPKVFFHEGSKRWVMVFALNDEKTSNPSEFVFYVSLNLLSWNEVSRTTIPGSIDCPDMFQLKDEKGDGVWVLWGGNSNYILGDFDGANFRRIGKVHTGDLSSTYKNKGRYDFGKYCAQTWDLHGKIISVGWLRDSKMNQKHKMGFNQQVTFPVELGLVDHKGEKYISQKFFSGINELFYDTKKSKISLDHETIKPSISSEAFYTKLKIKLLPDTNFTLQVKDVIFNYKSLDKTIRISKTADPARIEKSLSVSDNEFLNLEILADTYSVELIANQVDAFTVSSGMSYYENKLILSGTLKADEFELSNLSRIKRN